MRILLTIVLTAALVSPAAAAERPSASCADEILRIETAYKNGLAEAETPREAFECMRLRVAALALLVDMTYQSTLSWLAERTDMQSVVERDQAEWLDRRDNLILAADGPPETRIAEYAEASELMLERLDFFTRITADSVFSAENWG